MAFKTAKKKSYENYSIRDVDKVIRHTKSSFKHFLICSACSPP